MLEKYYPDLCYTQIAQFLDKSESTLLVLVLQHNHYQLALVSTP